MDAKFPDIYLRQKKISGVRTKQPRDLHPLGPSVPPSGSYTRRLLHSPPLCPSASLPLRPPSGYGRKCGRKNADANLRTQIWTQKTLDRTQNSLRTQNSDQTLRVRPCRRFTVARIWRSANV